MSGGCWADPLTRRERIVLARMMARACGRFYRARTHWLNGPDDPRLIAQCICASTDMADLHMDLTERAV